MLYVISSPIGSIEEVSLQAVKTLVSSDIILCEDTRTFIPFYKKTCGLFQLAPKKDQKIVQFYKDREFQELPNIIKYLESEMVVSLITEAGTPLVSDPGRLLVETCQKRNTSYTSVPGSSSVVNAGVLSGCRFQNFLFIGFLPKKITQVEKQIGQYREISKKLKHLEICFFESPKRINKTLESINNIIPDSNVCICKEMNKRFEEIIIDKPKNLLSRSYKGELTVVLKL
ncbi:hypothetical protein A2690_04755 [Candidatus Roizmanbacteria bacterium RIFCSPHIGHO2_01_FULL_39_12b]|uniref:Tetrapyrrole methylase domain-containing protein n=1 Tax=Candidatus Roizmanbacteria bacterium RIFCSPHIGHO2_01_FULL_39_12b TaxID=1802030 RepID=A0A1F7GAA6_9BACT|nr:MAG: hypothetical protein A2690_04755 [Candidatus Roizmanbacteria bacterium RIFCSPHIGHO2_01_FULL_39_12b]OGK46760.1 MAG: hypothetical protein A3B46_02380 [Candidatus Roizmanbacteria bacterium RIFCSPLOWO2_01_FULL_39_19]